MPARHKKAEPAQAPARGRPSKLSSELTTRIALLIRAGNTIEVAAAAAGIHRDTFYDWMRRGEMAGPANKDHRAFREAVITAQAESEATLVTRISKAAASGSWGAAAWLLERRAPERWGKPNDRSRHAPENPEGAGDPIDGFEALDRDELAPRRSRRSQAA